MKRLSEFKDEEALDVLADIIDSVIGMIGDERFKLAIAGDEEKDIKPNKAEAIKICLKYHKPEIVQIMATLNGVPVKEFHYNFFTLPKMLVDLFNDEELVSFFKYQGQADSETPFGSATESTEETENA